MAWREPIASEDEFSPLERLRLEIRRPRTWNDVWKTRADELREREDIELYEHADEFNLSATKNTMEMK